MPVHIEDIIHGVTTGNYMAKVGSQFGSIWGWDGLVIAEATHEQYAAYNAKSNMQLGVGEPLAWLGQEWTPILAYSRNRLDQVNVHTPKTKEIFRTTRAWLDSVLGEGRKLAVDRTAPIEQLEWNGRDGTVVLVSAQLSYKFASADIRFHDAHSLPY